MKDLKKGNFFENQEHLANRVQNLDDNGEYAGQVTTDKIYPDGSLDIGDSEGTTYNLNVNSNNVSFTCDAYFDVSASRIYLNLPTSDPGISGVLWENNGVVTVSAG